MSNLPRFISPPGQIVTTTVNCFQDRFLLKPSPRANALIVGVLAKAQAKYEVPIYAATYLSNHAHMLAWFRDAEQQAEFMQFVNGNIARELGRLHGWRGKFWDHRYSSIPVAADEASQVSALNYLLEQGCKEGLVGRPQDWPGVHSADLILANPAPRGIWVDRTALYEASRRKGSAGKVREVDFEEELELKIFPLPCWAHLLPQEVHQRAAALVNAIETKTSAQHSHERTRPLGYRAILRQNPHHRPEPKKKGAAPLVWAASRQQRAKYVEAYRLFLEQYRCATEKLRQGNLSVAFPEGCFPPARPFVKISGPARGP
jgi:REP element-mobilizing transposase RayT